MDGEKVKVIQEWLVPKSVSELRLFFGLANYYRWFVEGYSQRAVVLTDLLKMERSGSGPRNAKILLSD
ncbi:hypothetical protein HRI_001250100 [Hibiscus trionum]|uniref:Reverse transcriptase n=1 Tax=Hibiscus trionum TaxID=183268 RepID=A0A9W7HEG8_HIBTR|nr:hypothetical protein HRI_001250100 [Hibiscus trionum]